MHESKFVPERFKCVDISARLLDQVASERTKSHSKSENHSGNGAGVYSNNTTLGAGVYGYHSILLHNCDQFNEVYIIRKHMRVMHQEQRPHDLAGGKLFSFQFHLQRGILCHPSLILLEATTIAWSLNDHVQGI